MIFLASTESGEVSVSERAKVIASAIQKLNAPVRESLQGHVRVGPLRVNVADEFIRTHSESLSGLGLAHSTESANSGLIGGPKVNLVVHKKAPAGEKPFRTLKSSLGLKR